MKKQSLLLITGGILAFASCTNENAGTADNSQAKIDSIVNERVEMIRAELEMKNDSIINAMAMYKADSMMAAMTGKPAPKKPAAKPAKEEPVAEKPSTVGNGKPKMGNDNPNEVGNGKPKMGSDNPNEVGNGKPKMGNK